MGHSGALYSVRVRQKAQRGGEFQPLGNIDGNGAKLAIALHNYMPELAISSEDEVHDVYVDDATLAERNTELRVLLRQGQKGQVADIVGPDGTVKAHQGPRDSHRVLCGALFRLPQNETTGWLCAHVNNGRSAKTLLLEGILARFREDFPGLLLEVTPAALGTAVRQAVNHGRMDRVKLVRLERAADLANPSASK